MRQTESLSVGGGGPIGLRRCVLCVEKNTWPETKRRWLAKANLPRRNSLTRLFLFSDYNRITLTIQTTQTLSSTAPSSPGSVWAWRPASAARCSPPPARCSPVADEPQVACTPWCRHAADSSGAPPSGCSVGPEEVDRGRRGRAVRDQYFNLVWLKILNELIGYCCFSVTVRVTLAL